MLRQYANKPLQTPIDSAMNHDGALETWFGRTLGAGGTRVGVGGFGGHVLELEALGQLEVELDGCALVLPAEGVGDGDVDFGPVESAVAGVELPSVYEPH